MGVIIRYKENNVFLNYSCDGFNKKCLKVRARGFGMGINYDQAEYEAQLFMVRNALHKVPLYLKIKGITNIKQDVTYGEINTKNILEWKITLTGIALFR
jgi:hypothetical protein